MSDRLLNRHVAERRVKRLRRFAVSLIGNQNAADRVVLDVMRIHKSVLVSEKCPTMQLMILLQAVYQDIRSRQSRSQNISLLNPLRSELVNTFVKFQSLAYSQKAIISLLLIEEFSPEKVSQITDIPLSQIDFLISKSLDFLSEGDGLKIVSG
ncbi:hypothetical protein [Parasphingorhabdus cellanae]|uniref:RNA polymerase sigma factor 70 region 4 type 2 domain-containing protein n=1 Tax=Parasphingorhabdus cellanae TaxID=2806553 RepID=A0ABX7T7A5_9SPHN|nr:hypothetical protein [Parasphingorhabdus cellanae]QTD57391.1 hypothetical protein J4G78_07655 [Parasphingorhabdus cellanae]